MKENEENIDIPARKANHRSRPPLSSLSLSLSLFGRESLSRIKAVSRYFPESPILRSRPVAHAERGITRTASCRAEPSSFEIARAAVRASVRASERIGATVARRRHTCVPRRAAATFVALAAANVRPGARETSPSLLHGTRVHVEASPRPLRRRRRRRSRPRT